MLYTNIIISLTLFITVVMAPLNILGSYKGEVNAPTKEKTFKFCKKDVFQDIFYYFLKKY